MESKHLRILAIDPGTRHMGVAVLDGPELVYYGVKTFKRERPAHQLLRATRDVLLQLIRDYRPEVLGYENTFYVQQKTSALLHVQELEIKQLGQAAKLKVVGYSPAHVRRLLCGDGRATKQAVADRLIQRFPELAGYRHSHEGRRELYWLNMFDAVAVAVVCAEEIGSIESSGSRRRAA